MKFSNDTYEKIRTLIRIFETSSLCGGYDAVAVLDDAAGVSYGIGQFTHRSGSLRAVVEKYLAAGGVVGAEVLRGCLPDLRQKSEASRAKVAGNIAFTKALRAAAVTREMRAAQDEVLADLYAEPAAAECEGLGLTLPLSHAVVCDSLVHGSWTRIRSLVQEDAPAHGGDERKWVTEYVRRRHAWLLSLPRLAKTSYRTKFFLGQIATGQWHLEPPFRINGAYISISDFYCGDASAVADAEPAAEPAVLHTDKDAAATSAAADPQLPLDPAKPSADIQPPASIPGSIFGRVERSVTDAARTYDRVETVVKTVITRRDATKSLWTAVAAAAWQTMWAIVGLVCAVPRHIWIAAAFLTAAIALAYLYRQVALGKIRESRQ